MLTIPLNQIRLSKTNPRRRRDPKADAELAESVRAHGVLQPVLVRAIEENGKPWELVLGSRRYGAAKEAGLEEIPAIDKKLSDVEVLEVQVIENLQRADVHPLEEAEAYEQLTKRHGYSVDEIAAKVGKSRAYVYARMKLCALGEKGRAAFFDGKLEASTALLIARIPVPKLQDQAVKQVLDGRGWGQHRQPLSYREAQELIQRDFMLRLGEAPFDSKDADLVPEAGSCAACPKRTGNAPDLFGDVKGADVCTDPVCFRAKCDALWKRTKASADADGLKILSEAEAKKLFPHDHYREPASGCGYVLPSSEYRDSHYDSHGKYSTLCRGQKLETYLARNPHDGSVHRVWKQSEALAAARKAGRLKPERGAGAKTKGKQGPWQPPSWKVHPIAEVLARQAIAEKLAKNGPDAFEPALRLLGRAILDHDPCDGVAERRSLVKQSANGADVEKAMTSAIGAAKGRALMSLIAEMLVCALGDERSSAELFGFDFKAFEKLATKQLIEERAAQQAAKKSAAAPARKRGKAKPAPADVDASDAEADA